VHKGVFLFSGTRESEVMKGLLFVEADAIEKSKLRIHAVSEHHVAEFVRKNRRQTRFVWQHVDQSPA